MSLRTRAYTDIIFPFVASSHPKSYIRIEVTTRLPYERESKTVLECEHHAVDLEYLVSGIGIPDSNRVSGIPDSLSRVPDSETQNSGFHKQKLSRFQNADYLKWGEPEIRLCSQVNFFKGNGVCFTAVLCIATQRSKERLCPRQTIEKRGEKKDKVLLVKSFYKLFFHVVCSDDNDSLQSVGQVSQHRALTYRLHSLDFTRGLQIISTQRGVQQSLQNGPPFLLK